MFASIENIPVNTGIYYAKACALFTHAAIGAEAMRILGPDIVVALDAFASPGTPDRPWSPHAQGLVDVAHDMSSGVWMLRSKDLAACGEKLEKLVFAVFPDNNSGGPTEAEIWDWDLRAAWGAPLPEGHGCEECIDYRGRFVFLIAPKTLVSALHAYLRPYLALTPTADKNPFECPRVGFFLE